MRNNDAQHIVRLSRPAERLVLSPRMPIPHDEDDTDLDTYPSFAFARGWPGKIATLLLLPMIFIYPLAPAYAAETTTAIDANITAPADTVTPPANPDGSLAADLGSAVSGAAAVMSDIFSSGTDTPSENADAASTTSSDEATSTSPLGDGATATDTGATTMSEGDASSTPADASSTPLFGGGSGSTTDLTASSSDASSTDALLDENASTTTEVAQVKTPQELAQEMLSAKEDSLRASIRKQVEDEFTKGCVSLDTTGYYCLKDKPSSGGSLTPSAVVSDVTSLPDSSGVYKQIFMTRAGETTQLTHSDWDSTFPSIDVSGKSIVWQGDVSGRWQVFYASVATSGLPEIAQLTHSRESSFNPKVDGDDVVWQGWVDNNWEIFLAHRLTADAYFSSTTIPEVNTMLGIDNTWNVTRITTNSGHDMFPSVAGGLVTWQSFQDNTWNVYIYSVKTRATVQLSRGGTKNEKPRFAITWDERGEGGNARMVGYDIASGKTIDITNEARTVNDDKPYTPSAPISQPDQAALPISGVGTSTSAKSAGDASSTPNGLDI